MITKPVDFRFIVAKEVRNGLTPRPNLLNFLTVAALTRGLDPEKRESVGCDTPIATDKHP
jgi:hypothetical protein